MNKQFKKKKKRKLHSDGVALQVHVLALKLKVSRSLPLTFSRSHTTCEVPESIGVISPRPFEVRQSVRPPLHHRPPAPHVVHLTENLPAHWTSGTHLDQSDTSAS